jgi:predicted nucleic acid-binding protein
MRAIDTNVVVRFLTRDDEAQWRTAHDLIEGEEVMLGVTVLLEAAWVLRSRYGYDRARVYEALERFVGLPSVRLEHERRVAMAFSLVAQGLDLADALHLAMADECDALLTFDQRLARIARTYKPPAVAL